MTLRQLLRQHGITRSSELAKRVGISRQSAYMLWQGKRALSRDMAYRLSEATGISPAELFFAERPLPRPQPKGRPRKAETRPAPPAEKPRPDRFGWEAGDITITGPDGEPLADEEDV
jgi:transcriptional regulator with XRE-family HTH domain